MVAEYVAVVALALALDLALGDPRNRYHPTAWIGGALARLVPAVSGRGAGAERAGGILVVAAVAAAAAAAAAALPHALGLGISLLAGGWAAALASAAAGAVLLKTTVAVRGMERHAAAVADSLDRGDLDAARAGLSAIVKRDTADLDGDHVVSGVIESVSENTVDGVTGPLLYYAALGLPGAFAYRAVNTADSMIGYRTAMFRDVGWFAARCDTVLNYAPARLTGLVMVLSAAVLGRDWRASYRVMVRDGGKTESPNAGYAMAAMAGAIGARLEKAGHYRLGDGACAAAAPASARGQIESAVSMMKVTSVLFSLLVAAPAIAALSAAGWRWWW